MLPWVVGETVRPRRSATVLIAELAGTTMASPPYLGDRLAATTVMSGVAASAFKVGASPATPMSNAPARSASSSGAAAGNSPQLIWYGAPSSTPEARSSACWMPAWSPTRRVTEDSSTGPSALGAPEHAASATSTAAARAGRNRRGPLIGLLVLVRGREWRWSL